MSLATYYPHNPVAPQWVMIDSPEEERERDELGNTSSEVVSDSSISTTSTTATSTTEALLRLRLVQRLSPELSVDSTTTISTTTTMPSEPSINTQESQREDSRDLIRTAMAEEIVQIMPSSSSSSSLLHSPWRESMNMEVVAVSPFVTSEDLLQSRPSSMIGTLCSYTQTASETPLAPPVLPARNAREGSGGAASQADRRSSSTESPTTSSLPQSPPSPSHNIFDDGEAEERNENAVMATPLPVATVCPSTLQITVLTLPEKDSVWKPSKGLCHCKATLIDSYGVPKKEYGFAFNLRELNRLHRELVSVPGVSPPSQNAIRDFLALLYTPSKRHSGSAVQERKRRKLEEYLNKLMHQKALFTVPNASWWNGIGILDRQIVQKIESVVDSEYKSSQSIASHPVIQSLLFQRQVHFTVPLDLHPTVTHIKPRTIFGPDGRPWYTISRAPIATPNQLAGVTVSAITVSDYANNLPLIEIIEQWYIARSAYQLRVNRVGNRNATRAHVCTVTFDRYSRQPTISLVSTCQSLLHLPSLIDASAKNVSNVDFSIPTIEEANVDSSFSSGDSAQVPTTRGRALTSPQTVTSRGMRRGGNRRSRSERRRSQSLSTVSMITVARMRVRLSSMAEKGAFTLSCEPTVDVLLYLALALCTEVMFVAQFSTDPSIASAWG